MNVWTTCSLWQACAQDIGLAAWLNTQDPTNRQQASMGTATVAMVLKGLGESLRLLYSVPHFFANKPVEDLLGPGITAERRKCRLFGANPGLVVRLRSHRAMTLGHRADTRVPTASPTEHAATGEQRPNQLGADVQASRVAAGCQ